MTSSAQAAPWTATRRHDPAAVALATLAPVVLSLALWALALDRLDLSEIGDYGLVNALPWPFYAALALLAAGFCLAVRRPSVPGWALGLYVTALVLVIHGTPAASYGTLRYAWAWKHVGIVDYIQRQGAVDTDIGTLSAYHNWPGFFGLAALFTELAGFDDALAFAAWAPVFFNLLFAAAVLVLARALTADRRVQWLAVWLFVAANWVGQDYFAPQPLAFFLFLVAVAACIHWFRPLDPPAAGTIRRWVRSTALAGRLHAALVRADGGVVRPVAAGARQRAAVAALVLALLAVIVASHQLTPLLAATALGLLVLAQRLRLRTLPLLVAVAAVAWATFLAAGFLRGNLYWIVESVGAASENAGGSLIDLGRASDAQRVVAQVDRALTAGIWLLGLAGLARRLRRGSFDLTALALALAPFAVLVANAYGEEILFRVFLFSLPFFAFLAAALFYPAADAGSSRRTAALSVAVSLLALAGLLVGYYGKERANYFTPEEVRASEWLYTTAPAGSLLVGGVNDYPWAFTHYERYAYASFADLDAEELEAALAAPVSALRELADDEDYTATYFVVTRSQKALVDMTGIMPSGALDRVEAMLIGSPSVALVYRSPDAAVFRLVGTATGEETT